MALLALACRNSIWHNTVHSNRTLSTSHRETSMWEWKSCHCPQSLSSGVRQPWLRSSMKSSCSSSFCAHLVCTTSSTNCLYSLCILLPFSISLLLLSSCSPPTTVSPPLSLHTLSASSSSASHNPPPSPHAQPTSINCSPAF